MDQGEKHTSASAAAIAVTGNSVNGWGFWEVKRPQDSEWILLNNLRKKEAIATRHSLKGVPDLSEKDLAEFD